MCAGIEHEDRQILFASEDPQLPLLLRDGSLGWVCWGRAYADQLDRRTPAGGWARLESIQAGAWKKYHTKPVQIPAKRFMERSKDGSAIWFDVPPGFALQGAAIELKNEVQTLERGTTLVRAYVVTVPANGEVAVVHDRMPRLIKAGYCLE